MLAIKQGDLFLFKAPSRRIIAHGCNAQGVMGSGFALQIRQKYPRAWESYQAHGARLRLGQVVPSFGGSTGDIIVNCITQEFYGRMPGRVYVDYDAVIKTMSFVAEVSEDFAGLPVHIPLIGGGLAGGNKETLIAIFTEAFKSTNATLWLN